MIIRTNAAGASKEEVLKELFELYQRMDTVLLKGRTRTCYSLAEQAVPYYIRELKNQKDGDLEKIITDIPEIHENIHGLSDCVSAGKIADASVLRRQDAPAVQAVFIGKGSL